jgi:hypothetical protein
MNASFAIVLASSGVAVTDFAAVVALAGAEVRQHIPMEINKHIEVEIKSLESFTI